MLQPYLDNCDKVPAAMELNASFNLAGGSLVRKANTYSKAIAPRKKGTA